MHWDVIPARHLACPVVVDANAVRIRCVEWLNQVLAHQVPAIVSAAEALQRTILQDDRLKLRKNRLTQPARRGPVRYIANRNGGGSCAKDDDKREADGPSFNQGILNRSRPVNLKLSSYKPCECCFATRIRRVTHKWFLRGPGCLARIDKQICLSAPKLVSLSAGCCCRSGAFFFRS
jgi:hypothetical protein